MMRKAKIIRQGMVIIFGVLLLAACGGREIMVADKISSAEMFIIRAQESDAEKYAPRELRLAQEKLQEARTALERQAYTAARHKAEEALADAQLAEAKARAEKIKKHIRELTDSIDTLRDEFERTRENRNKEEGE